MAFPNSKDNIKNDWANNTPVKDTHPDEHNLVANVVEALQDKVGIDGDTNEDSHDYKLSEILGTDKAAKKSDLNTLDIAFDNHTASTAAHGATGAVVGTTNTQTLTNKTLTSPVITTPTISSIVNTGTLTLPTSTDTLVGRATTDTLTNKRITKRVSTETSSATPTINTDNVDMHRITAQAAAITSFTTNLSGTPTDGQTLWISITDNGTARAITWGSSFEASTVALPTTTVISTRLDVGFVWNTVTSKWRCVAVA